MFIKDYIGKKIHSPDGKEIGYARAPLLSPDKKRLVALLCSDAEEEDFLFPLTTKNYADDPLVFPAERKIAAHVAYSPLARPVYDENGKFLGLVDDVELDKLSLRTLRLQERTVPVSRVRAYGDGILLSKPRKPRRKKVKSEPLPVLGKALKADVLDKNGGVLFSRGTIVTPLVLQIASREKKLLEVTAKALSHQSE